MIDILVTGSILLGKVEAHNYAYKLSKMYAKSSVSITSGINRLFQSISIKLINSNPRLLSTVSTENFPKVAAFIVAAVLDEVKADQLSMTLDGYVLDPSEKITDLRLLSYAAESREIKVGVFTEDVESSFDIAFS